MRGMLYYPFVQPPRDVLAEGILYWDRIGSIVPRHYDFPDYLRRIADQGLYSPLEPNAYLSQGTVQKLASELDELLSALPRSDLQLPRTPISATTRLYYGKLPMMIEDRLVSQGLLRDVHSSYQGPEVLLGAILSLLARSISENHGDVTLDWVCHTNMPQAHRVAYEGNQDGGVSAWRLQMGKIFKVPVAGTDLERILEFRRRHEDERLELLHAVDNFVAQMGGAEVRDLLPSISEEVERAVAQIDRAAKARGLRLRKAATFGSMAVAAGSATTLAEHLAPGLGAPVAGLSALISGILIDATKTYIKPQVVSPYNYVHRARVEFATQT